ncbi:unnamed protein product [Mytilus edulis]|uniref:Uncharacterized protein n=1 Tax=Mytilus edulis TaxID=6550 RepID=A0A8S3SLE1_MYTED|nr:unnamed protein product [Mytilus edulis]
MMLPIIKNTSSRASFYSSISGCKVKKSVQLVICLLSLLTVELCSAANVDEACPTGDTDCASTNSECVSGTCKCVGTHYKSSATVCTTKIVLEAACIPGPTDQCVDVNAECKADTDNANKCLCKTTHYKDSSGACAVKSGFGGVCLTAIGDSTCLYSLKCTTDTCQCTTPVSQFFDTTDNLCKAKIALQATCTPGITDQCLDTSAECKADTNNANKCLCKTTHYKDSNDACAAKIALEGTCTPGPTDNCLVASAECKQDTDSTNKCLCKTTHYKASNGACVAT